MPSCRTPSDPPPTPPAPVGGLIERFLPHFLHELGNLHLTVRGNLDLEREEVGKDSFLHPAVEGLERAERLVEGLRWVLRPLGRRDAWDVEEATDAVLGLLAAATRDGTLEFQRVAAKPLPPREGDRRAFCRALLLLGLEAADTARATREADADRAAQCEERAGEDAAVVQVSLDGNGGAGSVTVKLHGLVVAAAAQEAAASLLRDAGGRLTAQPDGVVIDLES